MNSKRVLKIKQSILKLNTQISGFKDKLDDSEINNVKFNRLLISKAILKKELDDCSSSFIQKFFKKFTPKTEKLICDYFKS